MREFKFRAWFKDDIERGEPLLFEERKVGYILYFVCVKEPDMMYELFVPFINDDWIVEEYIGLKDKNGVEIYKGDIVTYDFANSGKDPIVGIVEYETEYASYGVVPLGRKDSIVLFADLDSNAPLEVVGNIYLNKWNKDNYDNL